MTIVMDRPFSELVTEIADRRDELNPVDRISKFDRLAFFQDETTKMWELRPLRAGGADAPQILPDAIKLSQHALRQFVQMAGYRMDLLERLPYGNVFSDMNHLIQNSKNDQTGFIRLIRGNEARAILSGRFTPLDDLELLEICGDFFQNATVRYYGLGELSSHFTVTFPHEVTEDGLEPGLHIANSEVGSRAVTIQAVLYRRICTNVLPRVRRMNGYSDDDFMVGDNGKFYERLSDGAHDLSGARQGTVQSGWRFVHRGDANALRAFVGDAIRESRQSNDEMLDAWNRGLQSRIEDTTKAIETIGKRGSLTQDELRAVINAHSEEMAVSGVDFGKSLTGVINGFTRAANGAEDIEQRYKLQVAGASGFVYLQ